MILMRTRVLVGLMVLVSLTAFRHPMHVSVTEIEIDREDKAIKIITHVFIDDIEKHYRVVKGDNELDITEDETRPGFKVFLGTYLKNNLQITVDGKLLEGNYLGYEEEGDGLWCYIEIEKVKKVNAIKVKNTLLLETFEDQTNLVHVEYNDDVQSAKLDGRTTEHEFSIEE